MGFATALQWLGETGSDSQVMLGVAFSFNAGLALLKRFRDELNARLLSAVRGEIETARNAGWLGDLGILEEIESPSFRSAVRSLVVERDRLESGSCPFVVWSTRIARILMFLCATASLACMAIPCTARWTALLIAPYPVFVAVASGYECRKVGGFKEMREKVREEFDKLPAESKQLIAGSKYSKDDIAKKLHGAKGRKPRGVK